MKKLLFLPILIFSFTVSWSQTQVNGVVVDERNEPLPFVTISFENSSEGTMSDEVGVFSLQSKQNYSKVVFSFIGYKTRIVPLAEVDPQNMKKFNLTSTELTVLI